MNQNYFFIDGSCLMAQIRETRKKLKFLKEKKLDPIRFIRYLSAALNELGSDEYKRAVFYFPKGEKIINDYLVIPDLKKPGLIRDVHFKYCGQKIKGSEAFNKIVLEKIPRKFQSRIAKSEKGVDMEICCDALRLASIGKLERLFLLTNDDDFLPLFKTIKDLGANLSMVHLSNVIIPNKSLLKEADSYDTIPEERLKEMFLPLPNKNQQKKLKPGETQSILNEDVGKSDSFQEKNKL